MSVFTRWHLLAFAGPLTAALLLSAPARAQTFEGEGTMGILKALGLAEDDKAGDDEFRERPPLVLPPTRDLPPPREKGTVATANPAWPNDPDMARRQLREEADRMRESARTGRLLSHEELRAGTKRSGSTGPSAAEVGNRDNTRLTLSPDELRGNKLNKPKEENWAEAEPKRARLSDPPPGFRAPLGGAPYSASGTAPGEQKTFWQRINPF